MTGTPPLSPGFTRFLFDEQAAAFRKAVLRLAEKQNMPTDVVVAALADTLGVIAATLDKGRAESTLPDKLHACCRRVEETYAKARG